MPEIFEKTLKESRYAKKEFMLQVYVRLSL